MERRPTRFAVAAFFLRSAIAAAITLPLLIGSAQAAEPSFTGPSMLQANKAAAFVGRGFVPNAPVSIALRNPHGAEAHFAAVVGADGSLSYRVQPRGPGNYTVTVLASSGKVLSTASFIVMQ